MTISRTISTPVPMARLTPGLPRDFTGAELELEIFAFGASLRLRRLIFLSFFGSAAGAGLKVTGCCPGGP